MGSEFNVVEEARKLGLEPTWQPLEEPIDIEEEVKEPLPAGGILDQLNDDGMSAEEIAKRYEEIYDKPSKKPAKKKKVGFTELNVYHELMSRSRITTTSQMISSMTRKSLLTIKRPISPDLRKKDFSSMSGPSSSWPRMSPLCMD